MGGTLVAEPLSVLVVDDDPVTSALLTREIARAGHPVRAAADGPGALASLAAQPAAVVVSDIVLPGGLDGVTLCRNVREAWPETEVILLTGSASVTSAIEGIRIGACDYLLKPLEPGSVMSAIARASARVARRGAERQLVASLQARLDGQAALLDRLPLAIFIADADSRVHGRNRAADSLLSGDGPLSLDPAGRLRAPRAPVTHALHAAIAACCAVTPSEPSPVELTPGARRERLRAVVAPLARVMAARGRGGVAAVLVDLPQRSAVTPNAEMLVRLYDLTPAEAQLAARLVAGETLHEACDAVGVAVTTGRTHLSRVFAKTGTSRQVDLVGLVLSGPALLASTGDGSVR